MAGSHEALSSRDGQRVALEPRVLHLSAAGMVDVGRDRRRLRDGPGTWMAHTIPKLEIKPWGDGD